MTLIEYLDSVAGSDLRTTERAVLWWLARRAVKAGGQLGTAWPSMADIVWGTGASRATVARSLAILRASGWLEAVRSEVGQVVVYRLVTPGPNQSHRETGESHSETGESHIETGVGGDYQSHSETGGVSYGDGGSLTVRRGESHSETRKKQMKKQEKKQEKLSEDNPTPTSVETTAQQPNPTSPESQAEQRSGREAGEREQKEPTQQDPIPPVPAAPPSPLDAFLTTWRILAEEYGLPSHSRLTATTKIGRALRKALDAYGLEEVEAAARYVAKGDDGRAKWFREQHYDLETLCRHVESYAEAARSLGIDKPPLPPEPPLSPEVIEAREEARRRAAAAASIRNKELAEKIKAANAAKAAARTGI